MVVLLLVVWCGVCRKKKKEQQGKKTIANTKHTQNTHPTTTCDHTNTHCLWPRCRCVVIEDSRIGLQAAKAAGMTCVVTKSSYTGNENFAGADAVHDCIGDDGDERFSLTDLAALLEQQQQRQAAKVGAA